MSAFEWVAVALVVITSSARLTRLLTYDHFPPIEWLRNKYADATDGSTWQLLAYCAYCMSFWATLVVLLSGYYSNWDEVWWLVNGILGASYLAAILMINDGDDSGAPAGDEN